MTPSIRSIRAIAALAVVAALAIPAGAPARAEGLGDLYVATATGTADLGVLELDTFHSERRVGGIADTDPVRRLEFNGKQTLYASDGGTNLWVIGTAAGEPEALPDTAAAVADLAHPSGALLYLAIPSKKALWTLAAGDTRPSGTITVAGAVDLLAASPVQPGMLAAQEGASWVDLVLTETRAVRHVSGLSGTVVAIAVSGDETEGAGIGYIALKNPNKVVAVSLETGVIAWSATLKAEPTALTASWNAKLPKAAVVAVGTQLFAVAEGATTPWRALSPTAEPVTLMATSYKGDRIHLVTGSTVVSIDVADPLVKTLPTITLKSVPQDVAVFPDSSTVNGGGGPSNGDGNGNGGSGNGSGTASPAPTKAPSTDTAGAGTDWLPAGADPVMVIGLFAGVTIGVSLVGFWLARRWILE